MVIYYFLLITLCYSSELFEEYYIKAEAVMKKMSLEEKIGQMFFPRYNHNNASDDLKNKKPGGFVLFAYDFKFNETYIQDYITKIQELSQKYMKLPLGLSVDEEGGTVCRVSHYHRPSKFPSPQEIYNKSGIQGILDIDQEKRDLLRKFYLNINLAPVADISYNSSDYIYDRTLGKSPEESANYIEKDVEGYVEDNFTCCAKHFPGYGNNIDTHGDIAIDNRDYETFQKEDFLTFKAAIAKKIPMILVSHNIVKCKDNKYPASLSPAWHEILRKELNFSGLILTDDLSMGAIKKYTGEESEAVLAVNAGNDILLTSDYYIHLDAVIKAAKSGKIKEEIINKACRRIIAWKFQYLNATEAIPDEDGEKGEEPGSKTLIVVVSILVGVIVVGCIIVLIMFLKKKNNNNITDDVKNIDGDVLIEN
jgi:beta-N-acetylhexosaminidase